MSNSESDLHSIGKTIFEISPARDRGRYFSENYPKNLKGQAETAE